MDPTRRATRHLQSQSRLFRRRRLSETERTDSTYDIHLGHLGMGVPRPSARTWLRLQRAVLILLVLVSFAAVQTASAIEVHAHQHGGPNDHCCAGCHAGHFPVLHTVSTVQLSPQMELSGKKLKYFSTIRCPEVQDFRRNYLVKRKNCLNKLSKSLVIARKAAMALVIGACGVFETNMTIIY